MDSPTKRYDEFTALIGETEASMRDKLSELTLPESNIDNDSIETVTKTVQDKELVLIEDTTNSGHDVTETGVESSATEQESVDDNSSDLAVNDEASDVTVVCSSKDVAGTVCVQEPAEEQEVSGDTTCTDDVSGKLSNTDDISSKQSDTDGITSTQSGTDNVEGKSSVADEMCSKQTNADDVRSKQNGTDNGSGKQIGTDDQSLKQHNDTDFFSSKQIGTDDARGKQSGADDVSDQQSETVDVSGKESGTDDSGTKDIEEACLTSDSKIQCKEVMVTEQLSDVTKEAEARNIDIININDNDNLGSLTVMDGRQLTELNIFSEKVHDTDDVKESADEPNDESVALTGNERNDVSSSVEVFSKAEIDAQDNEEVINYIENNDDTSTNEQPSGNKVQNTCEQEMKSVSECIEKGYSEGRNTEVKDTLCEVGRAECEDSLEQSSTEDIDKETGSVSPADTENVVEEGFMITDVRSLTEDSVIDVYNKNSDVTAPGNETNLNSDLESNENSDAGFDNHHQTTEAESEALETSQPYANSKNKRKSPNTVRRVTDQTNFCESMINKDTGEQLATNNAQLSSALDTTIQINAESTTDIEKRNAADSELTTVCSVSALVTSTVSDTISTESESTAVSNTTSTNSELLPVISNTFSITDISSAVPVVKSEPPEDEMYGVMQNNVSVSQNSHVASLATSQPSAVNLVPGSATIHKGRIINQVKPAADTQKLVMSKVPPQTMGVSIVSSAPATLRRYPASVAHTQSASKMQVVPRSRISSFEVPAATVTYRSLMPKSVTTGLAQNGKSAAIMSTEESAKRPAILSTEESAKRPAILSTEESAKRQKKLSTINIHSVGVARITDLIARKNPIPTYKPAPIPPQLEGVRKGQIHPCYECGDSFHIEKSLKQHLNRCSMKIYYKCEKCQNTIMFRNKCQLLNHLRSHLNIKKTQAVPIHIKSDSIEIETNFNDIVPTKQFEWYKESDPPVSSVEKAPNSFQDIVSEFNQESNTTSDSKVQCLECLKEFPDLNRLKDHVRGDNSEQFFCSDCPLYMNTKCGLKAHEKLHEISEIKRPPISSDQWKFLKSLSCPECGKHFWRGLGGGTLTNVLIDMALHLKNVCFHLSRLPAYTCSKCVKVFQSFEGVRNHLNTSLEHYYKCGMCPMALKSLKSLDTHYSQKHKAVDNSDDSAGVKAKIIYRCHVCDTLIDDRTFLVQHMEKHLEEFKKNPQTHFHCLQCGQMFMSKYELQQHSCIHKTVRRQFFCTFCNSDRGKPLLYISHMLKHHTSTKSRLASKSVVKFCDYCGLVCIGEYMIQRHACLGMRNARVVVGDRTQTSDNKEVKRARSEVVAEIKNDIPSNVSVLCVSCSAPFYSNAHRLNHLKEHRENDKIFICKLCDAMSFKTYHELRSHEIACSQMSKVSQEIVPVSPQNKQSSPQKKTGKSTAENSVEPYSDGVELTPEGRAGSSKRKRDVVEFYMCDKCDAVFTRKSKQEEHIKSEHGFHPCHLCGVMHESQSSLKKHLMVDHEGKRMVFYCAICRSRKNDRAFTVRVKLEKHFRLKHRMKVIDESKVITELPGLPESSKETSPEAQKRKSLESSPPEVTVKKLRIEGESDFKCAKCLFTCDIKSEFREHILEHKAADTYQCFECGLCFAVLPSLKKHLFMVHKVRDFDSYMEENKIPEPVSLEDKDYEIEREPEPEIDIEMEESSEEELSSNPLECKVCYRSFDSEKALKGHMRIHGMAFIKKSRRRAQASSPGKKLVNDVPYVKTNEVGKREGLILKIKMNRLEPASTVSEVVKMEVDTEQVKADTKVSVNATESVSTNAMDQAEYGASIIENTEKHQTVSEADKK